MWVQHRETQPGTDTGKQSSWFTCQKQQIFLKGVPEKKSAVKKDKKIYNSVTAFIQNSGPIT